jgi:hypothetical protein
MDLDLEAELLLKSARETLAPDAMAKNRIWNATTAATLSVEAAPPAAPGPWETLVRAPGLGIRVAAMIGISAASGAIGFAFAGHSKPDQPVHAAVSVTTDPTAVALPAPPTPAQPLEDLTPAKAVPAQRPRGKVSRVEGASPLAVDDTPLASDSVLQRELSALYRIEGALRADRAQDAMALLADLDRRIPGGKLKEERAAAYSVAQCLLNSNDGGNHAEAFTQKFPNSVYRGRVFDACKKNE